jgi:hypothetical protein
MTTSRKLALSVGFLLIAAVTFAQGKKGVELRTVTGTVVDKDEVPVDSGVVYLKNTRTQDVKTYITDKLGEFRFSGLDLNTDYELHAEREGWTSIVRPISNFDTRKEVVFTLKLDHKKPDK